MSLTPREIDQLADAIAQRLAGRLPDADCMLNTHEAARLLGCSVATVERLSRNGSLPSIKVGRLRRFRKSDLLQSQKERGTDSE